MTKNPLDKFLEKIGVKEFSELNDEEKETYRAWEETLTGRKITDEDVKTFFDIQEADTIDKLISKEHNVREDIFLKVKLDMIRRIKGFLISPEVERKILENNLSINK
jgi:hypothetical protein